jgi:hypothetical protein
MILGEGSFGWIGVPGGRRPIQQIEDLHRHSACASAVLSFHDIELPDRGVLRETPAVTKAVMPPPFAWYAST